MELHIRRYQASDAAIVWELHNLGLQLMGAHLGNGQRDADVLAVEEYYLAKGGEFLVGELAGQVVVMGGLLPTGEREAEVKRMRVHPDFWRRGLGEQMLVALEVRARELGLTRLHLDTSVPQAPAQKLYLKHGYREIARGQIDQLAIIYYEKWL
ncbi:GNAT family N-acetyltransferase [Herpetosiphon llansteffanensis]|uniref:GNAT family N-acetyltransferase n=1 Tax=Herpetosiphon llansteffanensis TaxID=2094568 RepID=UPI000D7C4F1D|nr:GNAT family N-acetyltransferase [Herpetosiphon llansteffanensis]